MEYVLIVYLFGFLFIPRILIEKTEIVDTIKYINSIDVQNSHIKYLIIFMIFNFFCFLFINKIREIRKIDYYKKAIRFLDFYDFENMKDDRKKDYIRMNRYLKLKKII